MTDFNVQPIAITGKKKTNVYEERQQAATQGGFLMQKFT